MLIATAGHIDHGKTTLIRALTGVETDRLPAEKARGISIDLGFAYWRPDNGPVIGFVDVPGHERFVSNMVAGLSGIDFALLVVAADDGVMPQTREHLQILDLLGIRRGLVAITKIDRVDERRIEQVRTELAELLGPTTLADSPILAVSAANGTGIAALSAALLERQREASADTRRRFQLAIDRAFSVAGSGTVVTGTVLSGEVRAADTLMASPLGIEVRVRGVQSAGQAVDITRQGQRCALNLSGIEKAELHRGDWLVAPFGFAPTSRIEVALSTLPDCPVTLRHGGKVHLHHGTADIAATVLFSRQRPLAAGQTAVAQLVLEKPTQMASGDRILLRDSSGRALIGGGFVLDPFASTKRRSLPEREAQAAAWGLTDPAGKLAALSAAPGCEPDVDSFARACNVTATALQAILEETAPVLTGPRQRIAIDAARFSDLGQRLIGIVAAFHQEYPGEAGLPRRKARAMLRETVSPELFASLVSSLESPKQLIATGGLLRLPNHAPGFSAMETELWRKVLAWADLPAPKAFSAAELARELRLGEPALLAALKRRRANGDLWQVSDNRFLLPAHAAQLAGFAADLSAANPDGFTAAQYRDASGLGRNFVIQLLEFFDRIGVTRRHGEVRKTEPDWQSVTG